jgi:NDP-sugar pyrophosphorylase family protein
MNVAEVPFIILCGGKNTRLDVLRGTIYKAFLHLRDTSLVARHIARASFAGHQIMRIVVEEYDPMIEASANTFREELDIDISVTLIPGSGREKVIGALNELRCEGPAVVVLGDTFAWYDSRTLLNQLERDGSICSIAFAEYQLPFGVIDFDDGFVRSFREKPSSGYLVNLGVMALSAAAVVRLACGADFAQLLSMSATEGRLSGTQVHSDFITVDSLADIERALGLAKDLLE